jgi:hypothetical protein
MNQNHPAMITVIPLWDVNGWIGFRQLRLFSFRLLKDGIK